MNKASAVMVVEQGIVPKPLGAQIAKAVTQVIADQAKPDAARSRDYLQVEQLLIAVGGPDVTRIHSGRSRQDIGSTSRRLFLRDDLLVAAASLNAAREALLVMAAQHPNAIVPAGACKRSRSRSATTCSVTRRHSPAMPRGCGRRSRG
jgi:argininosuccinate lyase